MKDQQLIQDALELLENRTGIKATVTAPTTDNVDGIFHFTVEKRKYMA